MKYLKHQAYLKSLQQLIRLPFTNGGFTLIEILVAVLIIGILAAVAVPQYQRALLKSRYAAMMPIAKSMANSNESYFLEHGNYTGDPQAFSVQGQRDYADGTHLNFGTTTDYAYVLATNPGVENNTYVVYQKHSENFPGNIHCEALTEDNLANQVCLSFGGTPMEGSLSGEDYTAYLLSGNPSDGQFPKDCTTEPNVKQACSGCGFMTRQATCNTKTGEWEYDGEFDPNTCPTQPQPQTGANCEAGYTGNLTRAATCSEDHTTWEFVGDWSTDSCVKTRTLTSSSCNSSYCTYNFGEDGRYLKYPNANGTLNCYDYGSCSESGTPDIVDYTHPLGASAMSVRFDENGNIQWFNVGTGSNKFYYDGSGNLLGGYGKIDANGNGCISNQANANSCYQVYYKPNGTIGRLTTYSGSNYNYNANGQNSSAPIQNVTPYYLTNENNPVLGIVQELLSHPHTKCDLYPELAECQTANSGN